MVFHVLNRGARRGTLFATAGDYSAFMRLMREAAEHASVHLYAFALMRNHWHAVLSPVGDGDLSTYMYWLTKTHAQRWRIAHGTVGQGVVYQGRFKAIPIETDRHFLIACRYVERNALRAGLVARVNEWRWGSAWSGPSDDDRPVLDPWPVPRPSNWTAFVQRPDPYESLSRIRRCIRMGAPYGSEKWVQEVARRLGWPSGLRRRGRPTLGLIIRP
jgi:putative transposase